MARVKRGVNANRKRKKVLAMTRGYRWDRKTKERAAKEALLHALPRMFKGRKEKKRTMRGLWTVKINAGVRELGMSYSRLVDAMKKKNVIIDRKILAILAEHEPKVFAKIVEVAKG